MASFIFKIWPICKKRQFGKWNKVAKNNGKWTKMGSQAKDTNLRKINEEFLADQALIFKNTSLLNDCKPTKEFLTMEQRMAGYCCISKLRVNTIDKNTGKKVELEVIEPKERRDEMKKILPGHICKKNWWGARFSKELP